MAKVPVDLYVFGNHAREAELRLLQATDAEKIAGILKGLRTGGLERSTALRLFASLSLEGKQELFPELVRLATAHGHIVRCCELIGSLPRAWVLEHVEAVAEPLIAGASQQYQFEEYRRLLELYRFLGDRELLQRLARRAIAHPDEEVREGGEDAMKWGEMMAW